MRRRIVVSSLVLLALLAAPGAPHLDSGLRAALDATEDEMRGALQNADAAGLARSYTEDAQIIGTRGEVVRGRAAIARHMAEVVALGVRDFSLEEQELFEGVDFAVGAGRAVFMNGAGTRLAVIRYMTLWKKTAEGWRIHRDVAAPVSVGPAPARPLP